MEEQVKKRRVSTELVPNERELETNQTEFCDLNDDCIEVIFHCLSLDDLCSFSLTCKRFHKLANDFFHRQFTNHCMEISNTLSGPITKPNENYVKCFRSNIRRIRITSEYWNLNVLQLFTFVRLNCTESLLELELDTIDLRAKECYGKQIQIQLNNLTTISFINCTVHDIYNGFLQYCHNLKHLIVKEETPINMNIEWLLNCYPRLESFVYYSPMSLGFSTDRKHLNAACIDIALRQFFRLNPHIKNMACSCNNIIRAIIEEKMSLDYLVLHIDDESSLIAHFNDLLLICDEKHVQRLRFDFRYYVLFGNDIEERLTRLSKRVVFDGVWLKEMLNIEERVFINVKSLHLELNRTNERFTSLSITMPHLEELHLYPWHKAFIDSFNEMFTFASNFQRLRTLVIHRIDEKLISTDLIAQMDQKRQQSTPNCPLTIYLPYETIQKIEFNIRVGKSVHVKPISALKRDIFTSERQTFWFLLKETNRKQQIRYEKCLYKQIEK